MKIYVIIILLLMVIIQCANTSNQCLTTIKEVNPKRVIHLDGQSLEISFELTRRPTQRLVSRIMKIFLVEILGYSGVKLIEKDDWFDATTVISRMSETLTYTDQTIVPETMVNMEVWIPPQEDTMQILSRYDVKECGSITTPGRFNWYIPVELSDPDDSWRTFAYPETASRFDLNDNILKIINNLTQAPNGRYYCQEAFCNKGMYIPPHCKNHSNQNNKSSCALLLASESDITYFIKDHIDILKLYVKVIWIGPHLRNFTKFLTKEYLATSNHKLQSFSILHWTPSDVIPNERDFIAIEFPGCGSRGLNIGCVYESNRLVKLAWSKLETIGKFAWEAINRAQLSAKMYEDLISRYNNLIDLNISEDDIACGWIKDNLNHTLHYWMPNDDDKNILYIGGIFPMTGTPYTAKSIAVAALMARQAINKNNTLLRDYDITLLASDGQCKSDMVMKSFIDYIVHNYYKKLIGVLGPACSETIEPLIGISRHYKTMIISYSAEGSTFNDRSRYPYFFRTIGENKQYRHAYLQLFQRFGWKRIAALTEDGQKYTEYISYMQELLRENGINFIANVKFPREREGHQMTEYLEDLKKIRAKIIIADVYDTIARQVMCEAYKLKMTAYDGYVWFLPLWLQTNWFDTDEYNKNGENVPCSTSEMVEAINGHLSVSYVYFAKDDSLMQEGIKVREWRNKYEELCRNKKLLPSPYAGYVYDAMWTYAYAVDKLIKENQSYIFDLHSNQTVNRLTNIIASTNFEGVSGNIKFYGGPSRLSMITIAQRINNGSKTVGNFYPNISETKGEIIGGKLELNESAIVWLNLKLPDDGSELPARCILAGLAELLNVSCEVAIVIANVIGLSLLGGFLITGFIIVKKKYDEKVRLQEKVLESFGLDPRQATLDLDKWEIPRERVVINRKLGEGAFGTVYGGEAFFPEKGWLAVAVKTLKLGSTTEQKLDFLSEVEVMKRFEHKNIIKLLGVCIKTTPVLTVMEFMLYGDLKTYLLARRHLVNDHNYEDTDEISNKKLTAMALDVACGLSYLAQLKYVHRDVASRNCLVNAQRVVKLGDFGMTRPMYENDYYKFSRKGMLPVRWMAPESLSFGVFSPASDVWSYGVLLYEIVTFGSFPFQGLSNNQVLSYVKEGKTLDIPKGVKPQLETLIKSCWAFDYTKRPSAPEIVDFLAMNPRVLSPCLDGPLSSVQIDHSGDIDSLTKSAKKFSISLGWPPSQRQLSPSTSNQLTIPNSRNAQLIDNNCNFDTETRENDDDDDDDDTDDVVNIKRLIEMSNDYNKCSVPLLSNNNKTHNINNNQLPIFIQSNENSENIPKYVNIQPGSYVANDSLETKDQSDSDL
ncbi:uncharacterized protein LOC103568771 [Microplitis demolitor]|uniref:uncharacterized protein LOC103568771 n=1 Tax=Microplitis demolitor TaxID=69319 RepID=UPI00235B5F87|nr:uncharacterized protein LOC103568771 [Microplitis demolitor]XP_008543959.2 uncharacterized protein LOC103568771 [Microplitis demolitor]